MSNPTAPGAGNGAHTLLPWRVKLVTKLLLGILPLPYETIRAAVTGYRGGMVDPEYAQSVFERHFERHGQYGQHGEPGTFLELGPGGSLTSGILAISKGFGESVLIDIGDFASGDIEIYEDAFRRYLPDKLEELIAKYAALRRVDTALRHFKIRYETNGLESLRGIPSGTVGFSFSQAVLEHVRKDEFDDILRELYRVHGRGAVSSHRIDFKDHLGGSLNNMRFSTKLWESRLFPNGGFYTNRLRYCDMRDSCRQAGFEIVSERLEKWDVLPVAKQKMAREFRRYSDEDLLVKGGDLVLRVPGN